MSRLLVICLSVCLLAGACKKDNTAANQAKAQGVIDDKLIQDYITKNNLSATAIKVKIGNQDTTGVWYVVNAPGAGTNIITTSSLVTVGYTARILTSGTVFQKTNDFHPSFTLGNMIKGWQLGLPASGVKKGGKVRLIMASRYGYGPYDQPTLNLPANSVLDFDIEFFDITN